MPAAAPASSPTLKSFPRPAAVPAEHTSFVDRRAHLAEARALLGDTRLLTVLGPGGVGKSRFVIRLVNGVRKQYADDVWFFDLSSVAPAGSVADHLATRLRLASRSGDQDADLAGYFSDRRGLLVLDSCEHVLDSVTALVLRILDDCPGMSVIATSRSLLRLTAETVYELPPLALPGTGVPVERSAVQLFLERSSGVASRPSEAELIDIAEICRRLDGIPLAVELAATRTRALSPRQILDRLDEPLTLLTQGDRDQPLRQRTLNATIGWSYGLCTEAERELWRRMSVFVGPWDIESAEWMQDGAPPGSVLDTVASLLDKSIIQRRHSPGTVATYAMLDTVREFGVRMMSADERERARERHRDWYVERLTAMEVDWYGPNQLDWLRLARRELPNIRAALEFSLEGGDAATAATLLVTAWQVVWRANGRFDELRRWGLRTLGLAAPPTVDQCELLCIIAAMEAAQGAVDSSLARLDEAAVIAERLGDRRAIAYTLGMRGYASPDPDDKIRFFERAIALVAPSKRYIARGNIEQRLAVVHDLLGHTDVATRMRTALVASAVEAGETYETSDLLSFMGLNAIMRGEHENATALLRQALSLIQELQNPLLLAQVEEALANAAILGDDVTRAATLLGSAVAIWDAMGTGVATFSPLIHRRGEVEARSRKALGARGFEAAFRRGQEFTIDESIAFALGAQLGKGGAERSAAPAHALTARELQVVALVGQGLSDREIAERLVISPRTAEGHVAKSLMKLGFGSRSQLAAWSVREAGGD